MKVGQYDLVNEEKLTRAVEGTLTRGGVLVGGVGSDATEEQVLAAYDKLGGLIYKNGLKLKSGCFYDFDEKKPKEKPEEVYEMVVDRALVDVTEEEAKALDSAKKKREELKSKAKSKPRKKVLKFKKKESEKKAE